jgi:hypothetical protein
VTQKHIIPSSSYSPGYTLSLSLSHTLLNNNHTESLSSHWRAASSSSKILSSPRSYKSNTNATPQGEAKKKKKKRKITLPSSL